MIRRSLGSKALLPLFMLLAHTGCKVTSSAVVPVPAATVGSITTELRPAWAESTDTDGIFILVSTSPDYVCGLRQDGTVQCRGDLGALAPEGAAVRLDRMDLSAAGTCGLTADGEAACWGTRPAGPPGPFTDISTGPLLTCGVRQDGAAACWGTATFSVRSPAAPWRSVSVGTDHVCLLDTEGSITCLGPAVPGPFTPPAGTFESVAVGESVAFAIDAEGHLASWGYGDASAPEAETTPERAPADLEFEGIEDGGEHPARRIAAELREAAAALEGWREPELRHQLVSNVGLASHPAGTFSQVAVGQYDACAIATEGATHCWGRCFHDLCEQAPPDLQQLDVGQSFACGVRASGHLACWGRYGVPATHKGDGTFLLMF